VTTLWKIVDSNPFGRDEKQTLAQLEHVPAQVLHVTPTLVLGLAWLLGC